MRKWLGELFLYVALFLLEPSWQAEENWVDFDEVMDDLKDDPFWDGYTAIPEPHYLCYDSDCGEGCPEMWEDHPV